MIRSKAGAVYTAIVCVGVGVWWWWCVCVWGGGSPQSIGLQKTLLFVPLFSQNNQYPPTPLPPPPMTYYP